MSAYWLAPALVTLRSEVNALWPGRDKTSDGWIGDKRHAGSKSDHNPALWPGAWAGVVRALDLDNDLGGGAAGQTLWDTLVPMLGVHPALDRGAYLIYNGRIISTNRLDEGARRYTGTNPHTGHIHVSVGTSPAGYNSTAPWGIGDDMALDAIRDYEAFKTMLTRALIYDARPKGAGADHTLGPTLWERLSMIEAAVKGIDTDVDPVALAEALAPHLDKTNAETFVDALRDRLGATA